MRLTGLIVALALVVSAPGCEGRAGRSARLGPSNPPSWRPSAQSEEKAASDAQITDALKKKFALDPFVGSGITASTRDGIVHVIGTVDTLRARARAIRIAASIAGVRSVVDEVRVSSAPVTDENLRASIVTTLSVDPAVSPLPINVQVVSGTADLAGRAASQGQRQIAVWLTQGISGVRAVNDRIQVAPSAFGPRTDLQLSDEVVARVRMDPWLSAEPIEIEVKKGVVRFSGKIASIDERFRALEAGWTEGVRDVDVSHLTVRPGGNGLGVALKSSSFRRPDREIEASVRQTFAHDVRVGAFAADVSVDQGLVTLSGTVPDEKTRRIAEEDTRNTEGVMDVANRIRVREQAGIAPTPSRGPEASPSPSPIPAEFAVAADEAVRDRTVEIINHSPEIDPSDNVVVVVSGLEATLEGVVDDDAERLRLVHAAFLGGARSVRDNLKVIRGPTAGLRIFTQSPLVPVAGVAP